MPDGAKFQVCDVLIPHTWYLIDEHNRNLYFRELNGFVGDTFMIRIDIGNYDGNSMAGEISKQILSVTRQFQYAVSYDDSTGALHITASGKTGPYGIFQWSILTDKEVLENASNSNHLTKPNSLNTFLGVTTPRTYIPDDPFNHPGFYSSRLQFNPIKYLFIRSANLGTFNTLGSFGERTIIKKVPVTAPQGEMILDDTRSGNDVLDCAKQTFKRVEFTVTDELGNVVNLRDHDTSFSLIFSMLP